MSEKTNIVPAPQHGTNFISAIPEGDTRTRQVCAECGFINYENPKIVVGSVCHWGERILMCRRAINPRRGHWTLPAGFLELHETTTAGAAREAWEEACARIEIETLLAVYTVPRISQVQLMYRARLLTDEISAGPESLDARLFEFDEIPWSDIAFPSVHWALHQFQESRHLDSFAAYTNPPGETGDF
ncbi:NUDIX hydrolase [Dongia deserti]|uniref:NUDIX hydrolase n=1 Tax=Dongia deserti TaxID=2268030 RepID=UPI000E64E0D9|nr:NUDIX hydrolase [Dongia deserti]